MTFALVATIVFGVLMWLYIPDLLAGVGFTAAMARVAPLLLAGGATVVAWQDVLARRRISRGDTPREQPKGRS